MTESGTPVRVIEERLRTGGFCSIILLSTSSTPPYSKASRTCSLEWTRAQAYAL